MAIKYGTYWDKDAPTAASAVRATSGQIQDNWYTVEDFLSNDHLFEGTYGSTAGYHRNIRYAEDADDGKDWMVLSGDSSNLEFAASAQDWQVVVSLQASGHFELELYDQDLTQPSGGFIISADDNDLSFETMAGTAGALSGEPALYVQVDDENVYFGSVAQTFDTLALSAHNHTGGASGLQLTSGAVLAGNIRTDHIQDDAIGSGEVDDYSLGPLQMQDRSLIVLLNPILWDAKQVAGTAWTTVAECPILIPEEDTQLRLAAYLYGTLDSSHACINDSATIQARLFIVEDGEAGDDESEVTASCGCNNTCYGYSTCSCNQTTHGYVGCTCDYSCNNVSPGCDCNSSCYRYSCTCHNACYGYSPCSCNSTCNTENTGAAWDTDGYLVTSDLSAGWKTLRLDLKSTSTYISANIDGFTIAWE